MIPTLGQRLLAEYVGTLFLTAAVIGSGIAAVRLGDDVGLQLLENALVTGGVLIALILTFQPVSAAFNPVVSALGAALGEISWREAGLQSLAQVAGCASGAVLANLMFDLSAVTVSTTDRDGSHLLLAEVVATVGLLLVVFVGSRRGRAATVAGYITAAYWFTSSTSFANPAITLARTLSDTFAGIAPASVPAFVAAQVVGALVALGLVRVLAPVPSPETLPEGATP